MDRNKLLVLLGRKKKKRRVGFGKQLLKFGDCLERMREIEDSSVDMVLTDPPYGTTACKWDAIIPLESMWREIKRVVKPRAAIVMMASQPFTSILVGSNIEEFKYCWVWNKFKAANFPCVKDQPLKTHEDVCVFCGDRDHYYPQMIKGRFRKKGGYDINRDSAVRSKGCPSKFNDLYYPKSILDFSVAGNKDSTFHPTQKPVALMEYMIRTYTLLGHTVLDFTMGSGTTGVAAVNLGRGFIGIEKEPEYFDIAVRRITEAGGNPEVEL